MTDEIVGIDLATTHSEIAVYRNGRPEVLGDEQGRLTDAALVDDTTEQVNITLPRRVLKRLDALAQAAGESRSGYIAHLTLETRPL